MQVIRRICRKATSLVAPGLVPITPRRKYPVDFSPSDIALFEAVEPYTMTGPERLIALRRAVEYIVAAGIDGDVVECGVWKGGSMMAAARTLIERGATDRTLWLFDTFEGMPPPGEVDRDYMGASASELLDGSDPIESDVWARSSLDSVRRALGTTGYPADRIRYVEGRVEDTVPGPGLGPIALLRLDTDWYESTYHEMVHLFPRLAPGGVLIIDDYGHWEGARRAVDQYLRENRISMLLNRIDYTGRIAVKPS